MFFYFIFIVSRLYKCLLRIVIMYSVMSLILRGPFSFFSTFFFPSSLLLFTLHSSGTCLVPPFFQPYHILYLLFVLLRSLKPSNLFPDCSASPKRQITSPFPSPQLQSDLHDLDFSHPYGPIAKLLIRWRNDRPDVNAWVLICAFSRSAIILPSHVRPARASSR